MYGEETLPTAISLPEGEKAIALSLLAGKVPGLAYFVPKPDELKA
jgi:hypothetical protein